MAREVATRRTQTARSMPTARVTGGPPSNLEQIRRRAFEIYVSRGSAPGDAIGDWIQAEQEVRGRAQLAELEARP